MNTPANQYEPDHAVPPGWILDEYLETWGISQAEFARRCGRSSKHINEIIAGKAPLTPETALQFEKVLGLDASIWLGIESNYRLHEAQEAETNRALMHIEWTEAFPIKELVKRLKVESPASDMEAVSKLLSFFGVASVEAWQEKNREMSVAYRHSPSFTSDPAVLATWLRLGELMAVEVECAQFSKAEFRRALGSIRKLTRKPFYVALAEAKSLCSLAGVALVCVEPFSRMALSGAARWLSPSKALIQLSARYKSDDHFWFSFFHEAAHLLLHSKKHIYVDSNQGTNTNSEGEADDWASDFLISHGEWEKLVDAPYFSKSVVRKFAADQGIAGGIVVGRLQHEKKIPRQNLNDLKVKLEWRNGELWESE
jgi:addiction module HigA family antidote